MDQFEIKKDESNRFLRPIDKQDVKYRKIKCMKFEEELLSVLPKDCSLCFHGTPIWNAEKIIKSGKILAEAGVGKENKTPLKAHNQIYVSTINNIWFTIKHHADLLNFKYPAGCIFVVSPQDVKDCKSAKSKNLINSIDFVKNPERLKYIITTPENIHMVKHWIDESKIKVSLNCVVDYDEFIEDVKTLSENWIDI